MERDELEVEYSDVYDTAQMQGLFQVHAFVAPFVIVTRKEDGAKGMLTFQHQPRYYFDFQPEG
jgi:hypothetical protein